MSPNSAPSGSNQRVVPDGLLSAAGDCRGSRVVIYERLHGGFSVQADCVLQLDDGRLAVMKTAVEGDIAVQHNIPWQLILEREVWMYQHLSDVAPYRPAFYGAIRHDGWLGLLLEYVGDASRVPPWTNEAIDGTARALAALHRLPRPVDLPPDTLRRTFPQPFLERIQARDRVPGRLTPAYATAAWWNWFEATTPALQAALDEFFGPLPPAFCHNDVRSDNMFVRESVPILLDWN